MSRPYWSYNQVSKYLRCPLAYFFEYVVGLPRSSISASQVLGSAVHDGLAAFHRGLMKDAPLTADQVRDEFLKSWKERTTRDSVHFKSDDHEKSLIAQGVALIDAYLTEPPPQEVVG